MKLISTAKRFAVWSKTNGQCWYCGCPEASSIDHQIPRSRGGTQDLDNLVAACVRCNSQKGTLHLKEYRVWKTLEPLRPLGYQSLLRLSEQYPNLSPSLEPILEALRVTTSPHVFSGEASK